MITVPPHGGPVKPAALTPSDELLALLGKVVLIPNTPGTKHPISKGWQTLTQEAMHDPAHLRALRTANLGVLLGQASGGLCTIDIDDDRDVEPFLADNPVLRNTTRTKRVRGCNLWVRIVGDYPRFEFLQITDAAGTRPFGEWRADGHQTLIHGVAIDTAKGETVATAYRFLVKAPPIQLHFSELRLPSGSGAPNPPSLRLQSGFCKSTSLQACIPASLHNNSDPILQKVTARAEGRAALAARSRGLVKLYDDTIEPHFLAVPHGRNHFLTQAVPFLYRAVAPQLILALVGCFYDCNRALFNDSRETHMQEAAAMLKSVVATYLAQLSPSERAVYDALPDPDRTVFRICRDLALLPTPVRVPMTFFLGFDHLGVRLGVFGTQAQRIMRRLEADGLLTRLTKGTRRAPGVPGVAGVYRWLVR